MSDTEVNAAENEAVETPTNEAPAEAPVSAEEQARVDEMVSKELGLPLPEELKDVKAEEKADDDTEDEDKETEENDQSGEEDTQAEDAAEVSDKGKVSEESEAEADKSKDDAVEAELVYTFKDATGKTFVLKPGDSLEEVLNDFEPTSNGQIMQVLREFQNLEAKQSEIEADRQKAVYEEQQEQAAKERQEQTMQSWESEIEALQKAGVLETPKAKPGSNNWLKDPAVQKLDGVFKFMAEENEKRAKEGQMPITSFGTALTIMTQEAEKKAKEDAIKRDNDAAKAKAELVGRGGSSAADSGAQLYRAGSAKTIFDL